MRLCGLAGTKLRRCCGRVLRIKILGKNGSQRNDQKERRQPKRRAFIRQKKLSKPSQLDAPQTEYNATSSTNIQPHGQHPFTNILPSPIRPLRAAWGNRIYDFLNAKVVDPHGDFNFWKESISEFVIVILVKVVFLPTKPFYFHGCNASNGAQSQTIKNLVEQKWERLRQRTS